MGPLPCRWHCLTFYRAQGKFNEPAAREHENAKTKNVWICPCNRSFDGTACEVGFARKSDLQRHIGSLHQDQLEKCNLGDILSKATFGPKHRSATEKLIVRYPLTPRVESAVLTIYNQRNVGVKKTSPTLTPTHVRKAGI